MKALQEKMTTATAIDVNKTVIKPLLKTPLITPQFASA
jgi:hypothetical protein